MRRSGRENLLIAVIFCAFICWPMAAMVFPSIDVKVSLNEKRTLAEFPDIRQTSLAELPGRFEAYFNDHFPLRNALIRLNNLVRMKWFSVSGSSDVVVGKNGWLFYRGQQAVDDYRGVNRFSSQDLENWRMILEERRDWLASRGIAYLFVVPPNKSTIYPEYLPDGLYAVGGDTFLDQLVSYLKDNSTVRIVDLRDVLRRSKGKGALYYRTDTHWTSLGAYEGYRAIIDEISKLLPISRYLGQDDIVLDSEMKMGGDLAAMLGVQDYIEETVPRCSPRVPAARRLDALDPVTDSLETFVFGVPDNSLPRAVMYRDSFAMALVPFLSESFSQIKYIRKKVDSNRDFELTVGQSPPDIVVEELTERLVKFRNRNKPG